MKKLLTYTPVFFAVIALLIAAGGCSIKNVGLYNKQSAKDTIPHIGNFYGVQIFKDYITSEVWFTEDTACITVKNVYGKDAIGDGALYLKWNRISGGCNWIGLGIGWDGWVGKNLQDIYNHAAIQFMVRSPKGTQKGLPWAMALEDYTDGQAWAGVFSHYIEGQLITEEWTRVQIPLTAFDFEQFDANKTLIKQLIIQFEAEGEIFLDELQIVPVEATQVKSLQLPLLAQTPLADGVLDSMYNIAKPALLENGKIWFAISENSIAFYAVVNDDTPLQNNYANGDIWNGDAIEIAFSTNQQANGNRKSFLLTDQHIGISATYAPQIWNWRLQ
ncbi:MAG: hypothetical protein ACK4IY_04865, partial [Chitinophagales bacterium]